MEMKGREGLVEKVEQNKDLIESLSGVRGIYEKGLTDDIVRMYALEYESFMRELKGYTPTFVIGHDSRPSSKKIKSIIENYLGCRIINLGTSTTPIIQNTVRQKNADGGVIISGSHNPPEYNGLKFLRGDGALLDPEDIEELRKRVHGQKNWNYIPKNRRKETDVKYNHPDSVENYVEFVFDLLEREDKDSLERIRKYAKAKNQKIVLDPNGGAACDVLEKIVERLGIECKIINNYFGSFARDMEPNQDSLAYLVSMLENENDLAFGFDCDADRAETVIPSSSGLWHVKEIGNVVSGQYSLGLIAQYMLENLRDKGGETKGRKIVTNDATSYVVKEIVESFGAEVEEAGVGEVNVVNKMLGSEAILAGEGSSSGFIHKKTRCRDGVLTMLFSLGAVAKKGKSLGEIIDELPHYYTYRNDKLECDSDNVDKVNSYLRKYYENSGYTISSPDEFSGIKAIDLDGGWVWFRSSATMPGQFRIFSDSKNKNKADSLLEEGVKNFQEIKSEIEKVGRK